MKFDYIIGNPPYQDGSGQKGRGHTLWTKFVEKAFEWAKENGFVVLVHPSLWRQVDHKIGDIIKSKDVKYLEIHDESDGLKTFGANTRYDWYVAQNKKAENKTQIKGQDEQLFETELFNLNFVPNMMFDKIFSLLAKDKKDRCRVLRSRSAYGTDKDHIAKEKSKSNPNPCVYSVNRKNEPKFRWSNTKDNGHFGEPKVIWGSGATGFFVDKEGQYAMTEWCAGLVEEPDNLEIIAKILDSEEFKQIVKAISPSKCEINWKVIQLFKKGWWKEFV